MKILVGMSGGVDSTVAALLLKQAGHEVIGATMDILGQEELQYSLKGSGCFSPNKNDVAEAKKVCDAIGIPHLALDCREQYRQTVLTNFRTEYLSGRTPNPCVICNAQIKFKVLPEAAQAHGIKFDKFATGHYARLLYNEQTQMYQILRGLDDKKDQSYFLCRLTQEQLSSIVLPLGDKTKAEIRDIAMQAGLDVSNKPDSQDFYTGELNDILRFAPQQGNFINKDGKILGHHQGYWSFTIGQRRGLGISADRPLYVIGIDKEQNNVILGYAEDCLQTKLTASDWIWQIPTPKTPFSCLARIRSSQIPTEVTVKPLSENNFEVLFANEQSAVTPGQSVVLYDNDALLGGGFINQAD